MPFVFTALDVAFCRAIKAWKNLPNKPMLFFNPLAMGKECLEILNFSVMAIKAKQTKKPAHNSQSLARKVENIKAVKMRKARQKYRKGLALENISSLTDF